MSNARLFRPLTRAIQRQPFALSSINRPAFVAAMSTRSASKIAPFTPSISAQLQSSVRERSNGKQAAPTTANTQLTTQLLKSGMPQLVPFFFVNEVTFAFILLPTMIYVFSKYLLPQKVRLFMARLFISKL